MLRSKVFGALRRLSDVAYVAQAGAAGWALRTPQAVRQYDALRALGQRHHLAIRTILYVGANQGQELSLLLRAFPDADVHCFEPHPDCLVALNSAAAQWPGRVKVHPFALSDRNGDTTLKMPATHSQASSLLAPNAEMSKHFPHVKGWSESVIQTRTLDSWAEDQKLRDHVMIKMDVQGAEPLVIAGGGNLFARARLVITELSVTPTYEGGTDMHAMFDALTDLGLAYAGEVEQVRDLQHVVVEFDGAFVRVERP